MLVRQLARGVRLVQLLHKPVQFLVPPLHFYLLHTPLGQHIRFRVCTVPTGFEKLILSVRPLTEKVGGWLGLFFAGYPAWGSVSTGCAVSRPRSAPAYGRTGPGADVHHPPSVPPVPELPGNTGNSLRSDSPYSPARARRDRRRIFDARSARDPCAHMPVRSGKAARRYGRKSENSDKH